MKIKSGLIVALAAGSVAGLAQASEVNPTQLSPTGAKAISGHVFINNSTGERVVLEHTPQSVDVRGAGWSWDSSAIDPCLPVGFPQEDAVVWVFTGVHAHDPAVGITPEDIGYWSDWMEVPENSTINTMTWTVHSFVEDPGLVGVVGHDYLFVLTENDRAPAAERTGAIATAALIVTELLGAEDDNNDGTIDFAESNLWIYTLDLSDDPFVIGVAADGGTDLTGNGLFNCGYYFGYRQPNVAEGDGLIGRFPELAGIGLENPDGLNPLTFPNIVNVGTALVHPSWDSACYVSGGGPWPQVAGCDDTAPFPLGAFDAFGLYDATGLEVGVFWFGGFTCSPATPPPSPPFNQPWANPWMQFNVDDGGPQGCNDADLAEPFGVLDLADISAFITAFQAGDPAADIAPPFGVLDLADIAAFVTAFQAGCP